MVDGGPRRVSLELLGKGRELAGKLGGLNIALVIGHDLGGVAREAARYGAERVVVVDDERLADYHPDPYFSALRRVVESERPHALLIPSTIMGRDYGPRVAGELELGMTGDCVDLGIDKARAPDPVQARLRRQHRLGDHGRDHAAARDRAPGDVRARRAAGTTPRPRSSSCPPESWPSPGLA